MKYLNIIRHGESESPITPKNDFLRDLNDLGQYDLQNLNDYLIDQDFNKHKIICSTSTRTKQTLILLKSSLNPESKIIYSQEFYLATFKKLIDIIDSEAKNTNMITIIGHNPGLSDLLSFTTGNYDLNDLPTSSIAQIEFYNRNIECSYESSAKLNFFYTSKNSEIINL